MSKFRKKPVVIEAEQWTDKDFPPDGVIRGVKIGVSNDWSFGIVRTLEGSMNCEVGDWIITGVKGERYPCKDEIFRMSYEPVEE